ncbi:alpha/beta fold hydrolase [Natronorubrum texcoconense]|uniref:Pimeloyl-ACP methyl ester carboxylesterase n=1 Tax=Natronorubrum texcoconense TaxID=1095776 RepID=A0A1G9DVQ6_9EURY|nr:alpha/beta hydrolase [Natronorubrum texcoconense]SDK67939.1 Pimeloyl-ACP methyl ester carboxylesterase [Natronorubrum texcoconense]
MDDETPPDADEVATIHRTVSEDGTEIAGRVHGRGPPVVLVPGAMGDGEFVWDPLLPFLTDQFTCYAMSVRSRGLSDHSADVSTERRIQDVTAFVESIGEPVGLLGWSQGGRMALGAAARTDAVSALVTYEPPVLEVLSEDEFGRLTERVTHMGELIAEDRPVDAARTFLEWVATEDEMAAAERVDFMEGCAPNVPVFLQEVQELGEGEGTTPTDPSTLAEITVPSLLLCGTRSIPDPWFTDGVNHVAEHVADPQVHEVDGTGHMGPIHDPEAVADEVVRFLAATTEPARS